MKDQIKQLTEFLKSCSLTERDELQSSLNELFEVDRLRAQEKEKLRKKQEQDKFQALLLETSYQDPVYPQVDYDTFDATEGEDGSCEFKSEAQAKDLISRLVSQSYYYGHFFKWQGPGKYTIKPSYKFDHDNEIIFSATYKKEEL